MSTIQAQLLFASGDKYLARKLAETERALRLQTYIYDARIVPVHYADGKVDIRVITKDVWTLSPGVSFARAGGSNTSKFNLQDENFLGWGKTLQVSRGQQRRSHQQYRRLDGSERVWITMDVCAHLFGFQRRLAALAAGASSPSIPWMRPGARKSPAFSFDRTVSRYNLGDIVDQFNDNQNAYELSGGVSSGLIDGWTKRWTFGMRYDRNVFLPTPGTATPTAGRAHAARQNPVIPVHRLRHSSGRLQKGR